jgi:predicted DNA-binding transcriptional regulator AlpA
VDATADPIRTDRELLTGAEVARITGLSRNSVYRDVLPFPSLKVGKRRLWRRVDVEEFIGRDLGGAA